MVKSSHDEFSLVTELELGCQTHSC